MYNVNRITLISIYGMCITHVIMLEAQKSDREKILTRMQPNLGHVLNPGKPLDDKYLASISTQKCVELWPREQNLVAKHL